MSLFSRVRAWVESARGKAIIKHDLALVGAALVAQPAYAALIHGQPVSRDALVAATLLVVKGFARQLLPVPPAEQ